MKLSSVKLLYNAEAHFAAYEKYPDGLMKQLQVRGPESFEAMLWAFAEAAKQAELYRRFMGEKPKRNDYLCVEIGTSASTMVRVGSLRSTRLSGSTATELTGSNTPYASLTQTAIDEIFAAAGVSSGTITVYIRFAVYDGSTRRIATELSTGAFTLVKQRADPLISNPALADRHPAISGQLTPYAYFGGFVQGESLPRFETDFILDSQFPAMTARHTLTITRDDVEILTLTQSTAAGVTSVAFDLDAFTATGQYTLGYTLKDGAGNTATYSQQFTVYAYSPPSVSSFLLERYRTIPGSSELADDGTGVWLTLAGEVASVNSLNATTVTLTYSHDGGTETSVAVTSGTDGLTLAYTRDAAVLANHTFDAKYTYDFVLTVTDMLHTVTMTGSIYKAGGFFCVEKNGVAVGMRAKNDPNDKRFDVAGDYTSHFGGAVYADGGIEGVTNYASGEVATGGKWIDGKPIYRSVVVVTGNTTRNGAVNLNDNNPITGVESVVSLRGIVMCSDSNQNVWPKIIKAAAVIAGAIAGLYGGWSTMLTILVVMMAIDYVTGVLVAALGRSDKTDTGGLSSKVGFIGIAKKGVIMLIVLLATLLDRALSNTALVFQSMTVFYYIANEGLSVIENADLLGVKTPKFIHDRLEAVREQNDQGEKPPDDGEA